MDPEMEETIRSCFKNTRIHEVQELTETLVDSDDLSENGFLQLSESLKQVHKHKTALMKLVGHLFKDRKLMMEISKNKDTIISNLEGIVENRTEGNMAIFSFLRARNTDVVDAALAQMEAKKQAKDKQETRRSKRLDRSHPYDRKAKRAEEPMMTKLTLTNAELEIVLGALYRA